VLPQSFLDPLKIHLASWGLKRFTSDAEYFAWQRQVLSPEELNRLHELVELKRRGTAADEAAFYDATAAPRILPVLYSQRYDYYCAIGPLVTARIADAQSVLDFGCGVGILTTFYAAQFPGKQFVGIDRSPQSVVRANETAAARGLRNVRFERHDLERQSLSAESYDLILATHALVQAEQDPGLPSRDWTTFERDDDAQRQRAFEARTGIGLKLDQLCAGLASHGRLIVFEKTRQLARRVPFQRALAARGLMLLEEPKLIRYQVVEETADDGPFYLLARGGKDGLPWDESPEPDEGAPFDDARLADQPHDTAGPLYENHWPSAQLVWEGLRGKQVLEETTRQESDGRQFHVELGTAGRLPYLYCANTFDQRQLVLMPPARRAELEQYYGEIVQPR
jgi:SAM-dependent methyltransferase